MSAVEIFRLLGSIISWDLKWASSIDTIRKKAQQKLNFLHQLTKFNPSDLTMCVVVLLCIISIELAIFTKY